MRQLACSPPGLVLGLACAATLGHAPAHAESPGGIRLPSVTITGSHIRAIDAQTASPLRTITRDQIERSGMSSLGEVLRGSDLSNNGAVAPSFGFGLAAGASGISLRGLGVSSTLVLLNGRRIAPYGLADDGQRSFVNLDTIPLSAVERIDILKDGASATYGADAVAGVVNIITLQGATGITLDASYGQTRYGDVRAPTLALTGGWGDLATDRYNLLVTLEARHTGDARQSRRASRRGIGDPDVTARGYPFDYGGYRGFIEAPTVAGGSIFGYALAVTGPDGAEPLAGAEYRSLALPSGGCPQSAAAPAGYRGCPWNALSYRQLQPRQDGLSMLAQGTALLGASTTAFAELGFFRSRVGVTNTPSSVSDAWFDGVNGVLRDNSNITLGPNHPDNPYPGVDARLRYVTADLGGRDTTYDTVLTRALAGISGRASGWDWEAGLLHSRSTTEQEITGLLRNSVLRDLLHGSNTSGLNPGGAYYRLGANAGLNPAALNTALAPRIERTAESSITSIDLRASRELLRLQEQPVQLALGVELRRERSDNPPPPFSDSADVIGLNYQSFSAKRTVSAAFAELSVPVLATLRLTAALRADHYSDYGSSVAPKLGLVYRPTPAWLLRASSASSFRAPGPAESGAGVGGAAGYTSVVDPIRCPGGAPAPGASQNDCNAQVLAISAANPQARPERARARTIGLVFQPIRGTLVGLDFWHYSRRDEIQGADPAVVLQNPTGFPSARIVRGADELPGVPGSGSLLSIATPYVNAPRTTTHGVDLEVQHLIRLSSSNRLSAAVTWSHVRSFERRLADGNRYEYAGTLGPTSLGSSAGHPKDRATLALTWEGDPWSVTSTLNHVSGTRNIEYVGSPAGCLLRFTDSSDAPSPGCKAASFTVLDLTARLRLTRDVELRAAVLNVSDRVAPYDLSAYYGLTRYNAAYHQSGGLGRSWKLGLKWAF